LVIRSLLFPVRLSLGTLLSRMRYLAVFSGIYLVCHSVVIVRLECVLNRLGIVEEECRGSRTSCYLFWLWSSPHQMSFQGQPQRVVVFFLLVVPGSPRGFRSRSIASGRGRNGPGSLPGLSFQPNLPTCCQLQAYIR
jgi:hypothetical protein